MKARIRKNRQLDGSFLRLSYLFVHTCPHHLCRAGGKKKLRPRSAAASAAASAAEGPKADPSAEAGQEGDVGLQMPEAPAEERLRGADRRVGNRSGEGSAGGCMRHFRWAKGLEERT